MKVLIVKTSSMGDIIHTLPALTDAMHTIQSICFDWVVEESFVQIPSWHPAVNYILPIAIRRWRKRWFGSQQREERLRFKQIIHSHKYDIVIDAQGLIKSAVLVTRLAIGVKHGYNISCIREPFASWWYDKRHNVNKQQHAVERIRELFAMSLGYKKPQTQGDYAIASKFINNPSIDKHHYLVFLHATTRYNKQWPESHWCKLISLLEPIGFNIKIPWGNEVEHQRAQRLANGFNYVDVLPKLTLEQIALILANARAVVSVDTGLSHLTAALNIPNITLYGSTDPSLIGIYGMNQQVLSASKNKNMESISATKVNDVLQSILSTKNN